MQASENKREQPCNDQTSSNVHHGLMDPVPIGTTTLQIPLRDAEATISGDLIVPEQHKNKLVIFVHGSGSSRHSPRNRMVAAQLRNSGCATFLCDLLTPEEERVDMYTATLRFDIYLLGNRIGHVLQWLGKRFDLSTWNVGFFGASTGAAAALVASVPQENAVTRVKAIVSRGGRPDLAKDILDQVTAPTLLLVGGHHSENQVVQLNQWAYNRLNNCKIKELVIIPGATHLFEEQGKLEEVARHAADWFSKYLAEPEASQSMGQAAATNQAASQTKIRDTEDSQGAGATTSRT